MQKDFKIGLALGLVLVAAVAIWLSMRPSLSIKARVMSSSPPVSALPQNAESSSEAVEQPAAPVITPAPDVSQQPTTGSEQPEASSQQQVASSEQPVTRFHVVRQGETLSSISYQYYGAANKWRKIFNVNRLRIKDPNILLPGTRLIIPE
jgi:nucleoid-associated protein YgaU